MTRLINDIALVSSRRLCVVSKHTLRIILLVYVELRIDVFKCRVGLNFCKCSVICQCLMLNSLQLMQFSAFVTKYF